MKTSYVLFLLFLSFGSARSQSYEISSGIKTDTINKLTYKGFKEGKWILKGKHKDYFKGKYSLPKSFYEGYPSEQIIETGIYENNRKEGVWEEYYKNGKMRSKLTYANGVLEGPAVFYNTDGKIMKEGSFKANKWVQ